MLTSIVYLQEKEVKKMKKLRKIVNIAEENLPNNLRNFIEFFKKNVSYDNIKNHKKQGPYPLYKKYSFGKTTGD